MLEGKVPASQRLADRPHAAGFVAMLVPSFARGAGAGDHNLVFWRWGGDLPSRVRVIDDDGRLPSSGEPWR
jgi:RES domain-containing protein